MLWFKESTEQKPIPFRIYLFILGGNTYSMTGTFQWDTRV